MGINSCGTTLIDQGVFKNIGAITWDTTVKTSGFTAVSGNGYFCNTTSAAFTVTLPSSPSAGDVVAIADYANTFDTNNVTIGRNGSNIQGQAGDFTAEIEGLSITLIYVDGTQGWLSIDAAQASNIVNPQFVTATGGTITESGDYKIHTFTSPGTFCVSNAGNACGSTSVDYMVVAGGGGGGGGEGGGTPDQGSGSGAGAGGYRESSGVASGCYSRSPLGACVSALPVSATGYPITVGAGGAGASGNAGSQGSNSIFSSITSTAGGFGARANLTVGPGGSGAGVGGGCTTGTAGTGNTPPVSPPQGQPGAINPNNSGPYGASGGGGATVAGSQGSGGNAGNGGAGATSSINATPTGRAGGGGGGRGNPGSVSTDTGFGGGYGGTTPNSNGVANKGGGGGGANANTTAGGAGGSGIVIIRYKFQ